MLPTKAKRVAYALAVVSLGTLLLHGLPGGKEPAGASRAARRGPAAVASPPATPVSDPSPDAAGRSTYAIPLTELDGLPPASPPGTHLDIWVAWTKPITKGPRIQHLLSGVSVERILPPTTPDEPPTVLLSVPRGRIARLLYGDRWGGLSAVIDRSS
jgi:hypothetical protein